MLSQGRSTRTFEKPGAQVPSCALLRIPLGRLAPQTLGMRLNFFHQRNLVDARDRTTVNQGSPIYDHVLCRSEETEVPFRVSLAPPA